MSIDKPRATELAAAHLGIDTKGVLATDLTAHIGLKAHQAWRIRYPARPSADMTMIVRGEAVVLGVRHDDRFREGESWEPAAETLATVSEVLAGEGLLPPRGGMDDPAMALLPRLLDPGRAKLCTPALYVREQAMIVPELAQSWSGPTDESFDAFFHRLCHEASCSVDGDRWSMAFNTMHNSRFAGWSASGEGTRITRAFCRRIATTGEVAGPSA